MTPARGALRILPIALLVGGGVLLVDAVASGGATFGLFVIVPVVWGSSALLGLAALLLVSGVALLPLSFGAEFVSVATTGTSDRGEAPADEAIGGLVLVGPLPIFVGAWRTKQARYYWWAVAFGVLVVVVAVVLALSVGL